MVFWVAKAARNGNNVATDGNVSGKNGNGARDAGRVHAAALERAANG